MKKINVIQPNYEPTIYKVWAIGRTIIRENDGSVRLWKFKG